MTNARIGAKPPPHSTSPRGLCTGVQSITVIANSNQRPKSSRERPCSSCYGTLIYLGPIHLLEDRDPNAPGPANGNAIREIWREGGQI